MKKTYSKRLFLYIFSSLSVLFMSLNVKAYEVAVDCEQKLFYSAQMLNEMAFSTLIDVMYDIDDNLNYWYEKLEKSQFYSLTKEAQRLLGKKSSISIVKKHINELKRIEKIHAQVLGTVHSLQKNPSISESEYCIKTLEQLRPIISIDYPFFNSKNSYEYLEKALIQAMLDITTYKKRFERAIYDHTKSSHFTRHWWKYIVGAVTVSAAGYTMYHYKNNFALWYENGLEALKQQWQQRIVEPIQGIARNLSSENNEIHNKDLAELEKEMIDLQKKIQETESIDIKRKEQFKNATREYYERRNDTPKEKITNLVDDCCEKGDDTDITNDFIKQTQKWVVNIFKRDFRLAETAIQLGHTYKRKIDEKELKIQKIELEVTKLLYQIKQQWNLQEVNTMLGAMFPAALAIYCAYKVSSSTFNYLFFKKAVLIPLQENILLLRRVLNSIDNGQQQYLSAEMHGYLIYWTHKLRQYSTQLSKEQQKSFTQDIQELESTNLTVTQKHEIIKRMYDIYGFLKGNNEYC